MTVADDARRATEERTTTVVRGRPSTADQDHQTENLGVVSSILTLATISPSISHIRFGMTAARVSHAT